MLVVELEVCFINRDGRRECWLFGIQCGNCDGFGRRGHVPKWIDAADFEINLTLILIKDGFADCGSPGSTTHCHGQTHTVFEDRQSHLAICISFTADDHAIRCFSRIDHQVLCLV